MPKNKKLFECIKCDFICCKKSNYLKHVTTAKHKMITNDNNMVIEIIDHFTCDRCNKVYKYMSGLCRHKIKCQVFKEICLYEESNENMIIQHHNNDISTLTNLVIDVVKSNSEFQKQILDLVKSSNITNNTNCHNSNTFNLQVFLNEQCKDAMNINDFVDSFDLQISDLESVGRLGYIEGMSTIIINKIKELDVSKRPIHCSDLKREIIYIKDDDKWEREDANNSKFRKVIKRVSGKNIDMLNDWKEKYPEHEEYESVYNDIYMKLIIATMGGEDISADENKIMKIDFIKTSLFRKGSYRYQGDPGDWVDPADRE